MREHQIIDEAALWKILAPSFQESPISSGLSIPGCQIQVVHNLLKISLTEDQLAESLDVSGNALAQAQLDHDAQARLLRLIRILSWAGNLFDGDLRAAATWISSPAKALNGIPPASMAGSDAQTDAVRDVTGRIELGIPQ